MRNRAFRPIAAILSVLLLAGMPVHAGPVTISEVVQVLGNFQNPPQLRLRNLPVTTENNPPSGPSTRASLDGDTSNSILSGVAVNSDDPETGVDVIDEGDLEGTVCDCGDIGVPGGAFPKWPLLFLAAIPFFFIHDCNDCNTYTGTPTPTPTPTPTIPQTPQVPEPGTLLLFGSGLAAFGAGLRRRYSRAKLAAKMSEEG